MYGGIFSVSELSILSQPSCLDLKVNGICSLNRLDLIKICLLKCDVQQ